MALQGPIPVTFAMVFPHGCYIVGEVEPVKDFDASSNGRFVQARDKQTAELVWQVAVMDGDPALKPAQKTGAVKILAPVQPVPPSPMPGLPFTPVEFDAISVTPYVNGNGRLAYSIKVRQPADMERRISTAERGSYTMRSHKAATWSAMAILDCCPLLAGQG